ncbi:MAG: helix-turn-helix transcriptional regulator [Bacillota bacterium]
MGSVKVDLSKGEKRLETLYPLSTPEGVRALLDNIHHVRAGRFARGDYDAVILLIDFYAAVEGAKLTERQGQVIYYSYVKDLRQDEIAEILGISQQGVSDHLNAAVRKISSYIQVREEGKHE